MADETTLKEALPLWFAFFTEVGIINQLSRAQFEARLPDGITVPHFTVLNHLIRVGDGQTPQRMANAFQIPKASLTNTLAGLSARGLIEMRKNPDDGRSKQVWLTDQGRRFREEAIGLLAADLSGLVEEFGTEDVKAVLPHLEAVRKFMDKARD